MTIYADKNKIREEFDALIEAIGEKELTNPEIIEKALRLERELANNN